MAEPNQVRVFVLDTGPLITLAAANALDYLTYPSAPVLIPDAVFYEATDKQGALGAEAVLDWVQLRGDLVRIVPTHAFVDYQDLLKLGPKRRSVGLGERAAFELLEALSPDFDPDYTVLLVEDSGAIGALRGSPLLQRVVPVTTTDFLYALEEAGRINSADAVLAAAEDAGRHTSRQRALQQAHEDAVAAVYAVLKRQDGA